MNVTTATIAPTVTLVRPRQPLRLIETGSQCTISGPPPPPPHPIAHRMPATYGSVTLKIGNLKVGVVEGQALAYGRPHA